MASNFSTKTDSAVTRPNYFKQNSLALSSTPARTMPNIPSNDIITAANRTDYHTENPLIGPTCLYYPQKTLTNKVIVLDLDATLLNTFFKPDDVEAIDRIGVWSNPNLRRVMKKYAIENTNVAAGGGSKTEVTTIFRPHLMTFLIFLSYYGHIILWSAGHSKYVHSVRRLMFADLPAPHATLTSDNTPNNKYGEVAKPMEFLYDSYPHLANAKNTILIDDRDSNVNANPKNSIMIPPYEPKPTLNSLMTNDIALIQIMMWLQKPEVANCDDVRDLNKSGIFTS